MTIAVIPARGGSQRIPQKNIREFEGQPIIAYSIHAAEASRLFDKIIVSTDDVVVANVARENGAEVPFLRPSELATDEATTDDVLLHALDECQRIYGNISLACCIYPASPLITPGQLLEGRELLKKHGATSAFPVVAYDFPIEQALLLEGCRPRPRSPAALQQNSQAFPESFHDAGMFYWCDVAKLRIGRRLLGEDSVAFVIPVEHCQDINTMSDWRIAEMKYRLRDRP